ncbi:hypothetical protein JOQ06_009832, partial [Pogonophryne albipinna]
MAMCEVCNCRQVLSAEMMCFYSAVLLCFGMAINHGLQSTAKRHLLLSASLVVGRDYSQNKVQTGGEKPQPGGIVFMLRDKREDYERKRGKKDSSIRAGPSIWLEPLLLQTELKTPKLESEKRSKE